MAIYKFDNFLSESKEDKKHVLIISDKLKVVLKSINSSISKAILDSTTNNQEYDISFLDYIEDKDKIDKITYLPVVKYFQEPEADAWKSRMRQEMSVGKIINKLLPDTFKQTEVEQFVNEFKAQISKFFSKFRLVTGEDIRKFYLMDNYEVQNRGDINNSCMRGKPAQNYLDIYVNNPEKCKLLILMSDKDKNKIKGRALVWFGMRKPTNKIYMDRIYTIDPADQKLYIEYAKENGWLHKAQQTMGDASYMEDGKRIYGSVAIQLKPVKYKQYPSLDTLSYYTPSTGRLGSNPGNYVPGNPRYQLNSTSGNAQKLDN